MAPSMSVFRVVDSGLGATGKNTKDQQTYATLSSQGTHVESKHY